MKKIKKGYYLPEQLADFFKEWSKPGNDLSPHVSGALLAYMTLDADTREQLSRLAFGENVEQAIKDARSVLSNHFDQASYQEIRKELSSSQWEGLVKAISQVKSTDNQ